MMRLSMSVFGCVPPEECAEVHFQSDDPSTPLDETRTADFDLDTVPACIICN